MIAGSVSSIALVAVAVAMVACSGDGSPAAPPSTSGVLSEAGVKDAAGDVGPDVSYAICPPGLDASFEDLRARVFATAGCGTNNPNSCHSGTGAVRSSNLLDFTLDGGGVYAELVGKKATNISGDTPILRVAPFDAGASLLYVKLTLTTLGDPHYGAGMPLSAPGSVCPEALEAVKTWIDQGAEP